MLVAICSQCVSQDPFPAGSSGIQSKLHTHDCADLEPGGGVAPEPRLQAAGEARPEQQLAGVAGGAGDQLGAQDRAQPPRPQEQRHQRGQLSATLSKYLEGKHRLLNFNYLERLDKCFQAK